MWTISNKIYAKMQTAEQEIIIKQEEKKNEFKELSTKENDEEKITNEVASKPTEVIATLEIPKINLNAQIAEGTTEEIMNSYIGHFDGTSLWNGNIGLAAHNRGYPVNYFRNIKELNIGDEIIYKVNGKEKIYTVQITTVIEDTDWSYLEFTEDNRITLITCVENEPNYRRCVQAVERDN